MLGGYVGTYYFDNFVVKNDQFVSPPPSPPLPPPSPPPHVLMMQTLESYQKGQVNSQAWPEGEMHVTLQSTQAAHSGKYGILIDVAKAFDHDWHAQMSIQGFTPPDTEHGYVFSFWGRAAADHPGGRALPKVAFHGGRRARISTASVRSSHCGVCSVCATSWCHPQVVFQDADDAYTPLKQVSVPFTNAWQMYEVDISIPRYRAGHTIIISFWVGECVCPAPQPANTPHAPRTPSHAPHTQPTSGAVAQPNSTRTDAPPMSARAPLCDLGPGDP
jgi:hypothetical protein